jgi:hypothetical protein
MDGNELRPLQAPLKKRYREQPETERTPARAEAVLPGAGRGPMVPPHEAFAQVSAVRLLERLGITGNRVGRFLTVPPSHTTGRTGRVPGGFSVRSTPSGGPID